MAYEQFTWGGTIDSGDSDVTFNVLSSKMGDGYEVRIGDGIDLKKQVEPVTIRGSKALVKQVTDFLDRHEGWRAFLYTPPDDVMGYYYCPGYRRRGFGGDNAQVSFSLVKTTKA